MKDVLAEKLLAHVLNWSAEDVARERPVLQAMATFKYDEYEQFSPGMRFVESLARWLSQFDQADRPLAYRFMKERLVFCSHEEMTHLVETAYPDHIRPLLLSQAAAEAGINPRHVGLVANSQSFRLRQRQCLFLGLSDGARIDAFRRANRGLNHEQIWQTHELSEARVEKLLEKLSEHLHDIDVSRKPSDPSHFTTIVLLDDFSASGTSYYMNKPGGGISGKVAAFHAGLTDPSKPLSKLVREKAFDVVILVYVATEEALTYLKTETQKLWSRNAVKFTVETVQVIPSTIKLILDPACDFHPLIEKYYDHSVFDVHFQKGGTADAKYGYAACGLPVVLHHNTPNNSLALLWSYDDREVCGLFPRVQRHREMG